MSCFSFIHACNIIKSVSFSVNGTIVHPVAQARYFGVILKSFSHCSCSVHQQVLSSLLLTHILYQAFSLFPCYHLVHSTINSCLGYCKYFPFHFCHPLPTVHYPTSNHPLSCVSLSTPAILTFSLHFPGRTFALAVDVSWNGLTPRTSYGSFPYYQERGLSCDTPPLSFIVPFFSSS